MMAIGKNTVNAIGAVTATAILAGAYLGVAAPLLEDKKSNETQMIQAESMGKGYANKLSEFKGGKSQAVEEATKTMNVFQRLVTKSIDVESASRAIAASLPSGVSLVSFDFGSAQSVSKMSGSAMNIGGYAAPSEFSGTSKGKTPKAQNQSDAVTNAGGSTDKTAGPKAIDPNAPIVGFNRIPFTIKVSANNYDDLAKYLDEISNQSRLMNVVSVDSSRTDKVSATIYAFAYAGR